MTAQALAQRSPIRWTRAFWLGDLDHDWQLLIRGRQPRRIAKNAMLFHQGDPAKALYVIVQGRVRLVTYTPAGKERHIAVIGPNGLAGDCGLLDPGRHLTSAVASSEASVYEIPLPDLLDVMQAHRSVLKQLLAFSDQRFQTMLHHHDLLGAGSAMKRVGLALLGLAHVYGAPHPAGRVIRSPFTQEEMASICSISRVSVSAAFGELALRGWIVKDGRSTVLRDAAGLEAAALRCE
jgi:CRP-like cAMP-binding protein